MADDSDNKKRARMVVEEVATEAEPEKVEQIEKVEEVKSEPKEEKVEEKEEVVKVEKVERVEKVDKPPKSSNVILWILIPGVFLLGAVLGGIVFYQKGVTKTSNSAPAPTSTPLESTLPTSTPQAQIDLSKYPIVILNGSGIAGEAGRAKAILETAKFTVASTGNAGSYDFTKTIIKVKSDVPEGFVTMLSEALAKNYVLDKNQTLPATSKNPVEVTVGSSKAQ